MIRRLLPLLISIVATAGCVELDSYDEDDESISSVEQSELCPDFDCEPEGIPPYCRDVCDAWSECEIECRRNNGTTTTCGGNGTCRSCASTCTGTTSCQDTCLAGGAVSTCGAQNACQKYDTYCAFPTITDARVTSTHESVTTLAYMYYGSAGGTKVGNVPRYIGNVQMDNNVWASNFRGPFVVTGESARPQFEWTDDFSAGMEVDLDNGNGRGVPYLYGKECISVPRGKTIAPVPTLTRKRQTVFEDDECWGPFCNPDDLVGHFEVDRSICNTQVFGAGRSQGWTTRRISAAVDGSIASVGYQLYCYSCRNTAYPSCAAGIVYEY